MVYRIHFTSQDLARTCVASAPMPLVELDRAARAFQDRTRPVRLDAWRRYGREPLPPEARMALSLIPPVGWSPSITCPTRAGGREELFEQVRAVPRRRIKTALAFLAEQRPLPSWAHHLADDPALYGRLVDGLADLYGILLGPYESKLADLFTADRTVRMRQFLDGGVERLLAEVNPQWMRWNPPVLEIRMPNGIDHDLHLQGQGMVLVPSMFGTRTTVDDDPEQPSLTYPAAHERSPRGLAALTPRNGASRSDSAISKLLGQTRAAVLTTIAEHPGCSTKELATLARIAPASASEHATVLRQAGLISTTRHHSSVIHAPTALGRALLNQPPKDTI